jgi:hypothetical protein
MALPAQGECVFMGLNICQQKGKNEAPPALRQPQALEVLTRLLASCVLEQLEGGPSETQS